VRGSRVVLALLMPLAVLVAVVAVVAVTLPAGHHVVRREPAPVLDARGHSTTTRALGLLRAWDRRRSRAWARGDATALAGLYLPGSRAGVHDVRSLRRWRDRGMRVVGMHQQVLAIRVERSSARRLVLVVTDRVVDAVGAGRGMQVALPRAGWSTHRIWLRRVGDQWRVAAVGRGGQPAR
jgi:hypothetical protein